MNGATCSFALSVLARVAPYPTQSIAAQEIDLTFALHVQRKMEDALFEIGEDLALMAGSEWNDAWVGMFGDVLLRRLILHFLLCRAAFALHKDFGQVDDYQPTCFPPFPQVLAGSHFTTEMH